MKRVLLDVGYGPDGVKLFTDETEADEVGASHDSLFVQVSVMGAIATFGPMLPAVTRQVREAIHADD
jgi:hypothetical protein